MRSRFEKVESLDSIRAHCTQVKHMGLGVKVETNCLRDSNLIPRPFQSSLIGF